MFWSARKGGRASRSRGVQEYTYGRYRPGAFRCGYSRTTRYARHFSPRTYMITSRSPLDPERFARQKSNFPPFSQPRKAFWAPKAGSRNPVPDQFLKEFNAQPTFAFPHAKQSANRTKLHPNIPQSHPDRPSTRKGAQGKSRFFLDFHSPKSHICQLNAPAVVRTCAGPGLRVPRAAGNLQNLKIVIT